MDVNGKYSTIVLGAIDSRRIPLLNRAWTDLADLAFLILRVFVRAGLIYCGPSQENVHCTDCRGQFASDDKSDLT